MLARTVPARDTANARSATLPQSVTAEAKVSMAGLSASVSICTAAADQIVESRNASVLVANNDRVCSVADPDEVLQIGEIMVKPFGQAPDWVANGLAPSKEESLWTLAHPQYCVDSHKAFISGGWIGDALDVAVVVAKAPQQGRACTDLSNTSALDLTFTVSAAACVSPDSNNVALESVLFGAVLPQLGPLGWLLKASGLTNWLEASRLIPLANSNNLASPGLVEVVVRPRFSVPSSTSSSTSGVGARVTFRFGSSKTGGVYLANVLAVSTNDESESKAWKWSVSIAIVKEAANNPREFLDFMVTDPRAQGAGGDALFDPAMSILGANAAKHVRSALEFLALAEIGAHITAFAEVPAAAVSKASGLSLCNEDNSAASMFCNDVFAPGHGASIPTGGRFHARMRKEQLPQQGTKECHVVCAFLHSMLPNPSDNIMLEGGIEADSATQAPKKIYLEFGFQGKFTVLKDRFVITKSYLFLRADRGAAALGMRFAFGIGLSAELQTANGVLQFNGEIFYQPPTTFALQLSMSGFIYNAFGLGYLHFGNVHVSADVVPIPPFLGAVGLGGDLCIGTKERCEQCLGASNVGDLTAGSAARTTCRPNVDHDGEVVPRDCGRTIFARASFMAGLSLADSYFYAEVRSDITLRSLLLALDMEDWVRSINFWQFGARLCSRSQRCE